MAEHPEHAQFQPHPDLPRRTVAEVTDEKVTLSCGHELHVPPRFSAHRLEVGQPFGCHDCAIEGRA